MDPAPYMSFESKDTTAPPRFVESAEAPPYQSQDLLLKRCDLQGLDPAAQQAFMLFSSMTQILGTEPQRHIREAEQTLVSLSSGGGEYQVRSDLLPDRRFAGDGYLSGLDTSPCVETTVSTAVRCCSN